ncbi:MAG: alpha/beta hydrolase [Myxococcota bacterium]
MLRHTHIVRTCLLLCAALLMCGCVETDWQSAEPPAYAQNTDDLGDYEVVQMERRYRVRVDETVKTRIFVPAEGDEPIQGDFPVVLFGHGGAVTPERYDWLCSHIASRGFVVLAPHHALNLAIFARGNLLDVLETARRAAQAPNDPLNDVIGGGRVAAIGHSLGGVIAGYAWLDHPDKVSHLGLLASFPDGADRGERLGPPVPESEFVLSIIGSKDGLLDVEEAATELEGVDAPRALAVVEGMNHFQFTDGITSGEAGRDSEPDIETDRARELVLFLVDGWLDDFVNDNDTRLRSTDAWPMGLVPGEAYLAR